MISLLFFVKFLLSKEVHQHASASWKPSWNSHSESTKSELFFAALHLFRFIYTCCFPKCWLLWSDNFIRVLRVNNSSCGMMVLGGFIKIRNFCHILIGFCSSIPNFKKCSVLEIRLCKPKKVQNKSQ